jgi:RHS repeat-associated protein
MVMPGRSFEVAGAYRYGFNGKESDKEWDGGGATYDYGFRIYDPRIARFLSVDPLSPEYPWYTPYQFAGNKPIDGVDLDGLEWKVSTKITESKKGNVITRVVDVDITLNAYVVNSSTSSNVADLKQLSQSIKENVQDVYTQSFTAGGDGNVFQRDPQSGELSELVLIYNFKTTASVQVASSASSVPKDAMLINIVDDSKLDGDYGKAPGFPLKCGNTVLINAEKTKNIVSKKDLNTVPHELGHTLGLWHPDEFSTWFFQGNQYTRTPGSEKNRYNVMNSGDGGNMNDLLNTEVNLNQMLIIKNNAENGKLNEDTRD